MKKKTGNLGKTKLVRIGIDTWRLAYKASIDSGDSLGKYVSKAVIDRLRKEKEEKKKK